MPLHKNDLWVHRQDGYFVYRIPALVTTTAGTVLAFCEGRRHTGADHDEIDILVRRSFDHGLTWDPPRVVATDGNQTCGNPCPIVDETTGVVWLLFCIDNQSVFCTYSDDDGAGWSEPREITATTKDPTWAFVGTGPCHGIQLAGGRLLAPSWCDESPGPVRWRPRPSWGEVQSSYAIYSDDHGQSWTRGEMLTRDSSDECAVVETADGAVYLNARSRGGRCLRARAWSRDGGHTWSDVEYDPGQPEPSCQGSLVRLSKADGSGGVNRVLLAHPSDPRERRRLTLRLSLDECRSWPVARVITEGRAAYSDLAVAGGGNILCLYEGERGLVLARLDLEWLTGGVEGKAG